MFQSPRTGRRRTRFYSTRIRETLCNRVAMFLCSVLLTLLFVAGIVVFVLWLSLRPHRPRFYVTNFSVSGLTPSAGLQNPAITFDVSDRNPNGKIAIHYDAMDASLYYQDRRIGGGPVQFSFYQPPKNTTMIHGNLSGGTSLTTGDELWTRFSADLAAGRIEFRLDLNSSIRFELNTWDTHRHELHASCDVDVGPDGSLLPEYKNRRCSIYFG